SPSHVGGGIGVFSERKELFGAPPARVDGDPAPVETAVDSGGEVASLLAHHVFGRLYEQVNQRLLVVGFDREDVDHRHGLLFGVCHVVLLFGGCLPVMTPGVTGTERARSVGGPSGVVTARVLWR